MSMSGDRIFAVLTICKWRLDRVAPQRKWRERLDALLKSAPGIPLKSMGFPTFWAASPIWAQLPE